MIGSGGLRSGEGLFVYVLAMLLLATSSYAQVPATGRIPTITRLVKIISGLEAELASNLRSGNHAAVDQVLADDFEMRIASSPGTPIPREEWMRDALAKRGPATRTEQMSAHEFGDIVIGSFLQVAEGAASAASKKTIAVTYISDVWKRSGDSWKLARRFAAPAGAADFSPTGATVRQPVIPKRY